MYKATVLCGHPTSPDDFEEYYEAIHGPIASRMTGVLRFELTKFSAGPDGSRPAFYRMAELYFASQDQMQAAMACSPAGNRCDIHVEHGRICRSPVEPEAGFVAGLKGLNRR